MIGNVHKLVHIKVGTQHACLYLTLMNIIVPVILINSFTPNLFLESAICKASSVLAPKAWARAFSTIVFSSLYACILLNGTVYLANLRE